MDAVYRVGIDARCIFRPDAGLAMEIGYRPPLPITVHGMPALENIQTPLAVNFAHDADD